MSALKVALLVLFAGALVMPAVSTAQSKNCYHCYYDGYGKKICHDDCSCYGTH